MVRLGDSNALYFTRSFAPRPQNMRIFRLSVFISVCSAVASLVFYLVRLSQMNERQHEYVPLFWIAVLSIPVGATISGLLAYFRK